MELMDFPTDAFAAIPPIEVSCGGSTHTICAVESTDGGSGSDFDLRYTDHHGGFLVVTLLGGTKNSCQVVVEEIKDIAARFGIPLREATEWYAHKFTWTTIQAWYPHGGPSVAAGWVAAGVGPANVRILSNLGITNVEEYRLWQRACQRGAKIDLNVIREFVTFGVTSGEEALGWRKAGLLRPSQLPMWRARGVDCPAKLMKRLAERQIPSLSV